VDRLISDRQTGPWLKIDDNPVGVCSLGWVGLLRWSIAKKGPLERPGCVPTLEHGNDHVGGRLRRGQGFFRAGPVQRIEELPQGVATGQNLTISLHYNDRALFYIYCTKWFQY